MLSRIKKTYCINHPRFLSLREVFRPLYLFLSLLGLCPYNIKFKNMNYRFQIIRKSFYVNLSCGLFYLTIIVFFLAKHLQHIYFSFETSTMIEAIMTEINYITELMNLTIFCITAYFCAYIYRYKYVEILNVLASRIDPPNNNSLKILNGIRFQINVVAMGWIGLTIILQFCVNFTRADSIRKKLLVLFTFNLPQIIQFTVLAFFYVLVMMKVGILRNIREQTTQVTREKNIFAYGLSNANSNQKTMTLRQMELLYIEVSEVKQMVNEVFEAPILVTMIQCFHTIVSESHIIYHGVVVQKNMDLHSIVNCSVWIMYQLIKVYAISRAGNVLKREVLKLGRTIHSIPTERMDLRFMMEIQHFSSTISFHPNELTVYGFFPLDATLTFKIVASAAMYIIILVQFDKSKLE